MDTEVVSRRSLHIKSRLWAGLTVLTLFASMLTWTTVPQRSYATPSGGVLTAVTPQRILDTRSSLGGHNAPLGAMQTMALPVVGRGGIPPAGVSAVLVNVTVVNPSASGYLTLYQPDGARPSISSLDYPANAVTANETLVPVGSNGAVDIYNFSNVAVNVLVDAEGWVSDRAAGTATVGIGQPTRVLDTRTTTGNHHATLTNGQTVTAQVAGVGSIPAGVSAVFADIIAVPASGSGGYLTAYASDSSTVPRASNVNFAAGQLVSSMSLVALGSDGAMKIYNSSQNTNVVVDVMGWVTGGSPVADAGLQAESPQRVLDTRTTLGGHNAPVSAGQTIDVHVLGLGGVPANGVAAVAVHVTSVNPTAGTYVQVFASGYTETPVPGGTTVATNSSLINAAANTVVGNSIVVPVGANGNISLYNYTGSTNLIVDVQGWVAAPVLTVTPPAASAFSGSALTTSDGVRATAILTNANKYAVTTWWNSVAPSLLATPMTDAATSTNSALRRLSMQAYSLATALATGAYNPTATGVSAATATSEVEQVINTVAAGHMVNTPGGWGQTWGDNLYAAYDGAAAWMLWSHLNTQTQANVARMVYSEANWGMGWPLQYYANASGTVLTPGDTGSDIDSWLPLTAQLAAVMMPTNANVPLWNYTIVKDALVAWGRPADVSNVTSVNGAPLAAWISNGSYVQADGTVVNHGRIAPDYSTLIYQNMQAILVDTMAGTSAPQASTMLIAPLYNAFTTVSYSGKTVYTPGSAAIYYPQGNDWGTGQEIPYALVDAETAAFGVGNSTSATYENLHANAELAMQNSHSDGHTYDSDTQYNYVGREEHVAQQAAQLFYIKWVRDHNLAATLNSNSYWMPAN